MAKPKKKMKKAAPKARKVAPKAVKRKKPASKGVKRAVAVKSARKTAPKKNPRQVQPRVADVVTSATRASVDFESSVGRMQRAAVRTVGDVAARAMRAVREAVSPSPKIPSYDELPVRAGAPAGAAWGVFGDDDEVGTINLLTPERVVAAADVDSIGQSVRAEFADQHSRSAAVHPRQAYAHRQDFPERGIRARRLPRQLLSASVFAMGRARAREASGARRLQRHSRQPDDRARRDAARDRQPRAARNRRTRSARRRGALLRSHRQDRSTSPRPNRFRSTMCRLRSKKKASICSPATSC